MNIPSVGKIDYNMKIPKIHINTDMVLDIRKKLVNCLFKPYEMENGSKVTVNDAKDVVIMLDGRIVAQWKSNHNRSISRIAAWEANADKYNKIGTHIVTASSDGDMRIFDKTGHQIRILQHCSPISALFVSDIETSFVDAVIVSGGQNGSIKMWGIKSGKLQREFIGHDHPIVDISYIDNREQDVCLVSIDRLGEIKIWELATGNCIRTLGNYERHELEILKKKEKQLALEKEEELRKLELKRKEELEAGNHLNWEE